jgi:hypothetical protein
MRGPDGASVRGVILGLDLSEWWSGGMGQTPDRVGGPIESGGYGFRP